MPTRRTKRGLEAHAAGRRLRRPDLRSELRGPRGRPRARGLGGAGADRRPLRDRRAPDLGLRRPDRLARCDGRSPASMQARPSATLVIHTPHVTARMRLPWTFSTFDYPELCELLFEQCDAEFETAKVGRAATGRHGRAYGPGDLRRAAGRRLPRAGAACSRLPATSRRTRRCRAGSRSTRAAPPTSSRSGSTAATCPAGYGWSFPADDEVRVGVGSFDPRFHVKEPTVRLARGPRPRCGPLPGQLDPPPAAPRDRGRGLLRRRLGRALPAADRRGNPHRVLLRDRLRARAAPGGRRPGDARRRRCDATRPSRPARWHFAGCSACSGWSRGSRPACSRPPCAG